MMQNTSTGETTMQNTSTGKTTMQNTSTGQTTMQNTSTGKTTTQTTSTGETGMATIQDTDIRTSGLLPGNGHTRTPMNGEENLLEKNTSTLKMDTQETTKVHNTNVYIYPYIVKSVIPQIK